MGVSAKRPYSTIFFRGYAKKNSVHSVFSVVKIFWCDCSGTEDTKFPMVGATRWVALLNISTLGGGRLTESPLQVAGILLICA